MLMVRQLRRKAGTDAGRHARLSCPRLDEGCDRIVHPRTTRRRLGERIEAQDTLHGICQQPQMLLERRRQGIEPVNRTDEVGHRSGRGGVLDAQRYDWDAAADHPLDLAADLR